MSVSNPDLPLHAREDGAIGTTKKLAEPSEVANEYYQEK